MSNDWKNAASIYEFSAVDIDGNEVHLSKYRNHVCIIVNVACDCGLTDVNYTQLQSLYEKYSEQGLRILAFPSNQFEQEPGSELDIKEFVNKKYQVKFDLFSKIELNGANAHPLYTYLKYKTSGKEDSKIKWNFSKYLINNQGVPVKHYGTTVEPNSFEKEIVSLLTTNAKL